MSSWRELEAAEAEFAARVRERLEARKHKTLATLRRDGSPRISGTEAFFADGELWFGSMPRAVKARDLQRDPRFALHGGSEDPPEWSADAKLAGRAEEITDSAEVDRVMAIAEGGEGADDADAEGGEEGGAGQAAPREMHLFRAEIEEVVLTGLNEARDRLVVESWHPGRGYERIERT